MKYGDWQKQPDDLSNPPDDCYTKVWTAIGGRPWTFIMRDFWHRHPKTLIWFAIAAVNIALFFGTVIGHVFWRD